MFNKIDELRDEAIEANKYSCDDFTCKFAGTACCVKESCNTCDLNGCRGCVHFEECIEEEKTGETEEHNIQITDVLNIIATHIILCAEELKRVGFSIEDFKY